MTGKDFLHRLAANPAVYDVIQTVAGAGAVRRRLTPHLAAAGGMTVLDIGAGTGLYVSCLPDTARHVAIDNDVRKLEGLRHSHSGRSRVVLADAVQLSFGDHSVDYALCLHVTHHLDDVALGRCLAELARVVRLRLILQDPVVTNRLLGRALWSLDRGSHPRSAETLIGFVEQHFTITQIDRYAALHDLVLIVAVPRQSA